MWAELYVKVLNLRFVNGRFGSDKNLGVFTCFTHNKGKSAIEYAIVPPMLFDYLSDFKVFEFDDMLSDTHSPICIYLHDKNAKQEGFACIDDAYDIDTDMNIADDNDMVNDNFDYVLKWAEGSDLKYQNAFTTDDVDKLNEKFDTLRSNATQKGVDGFCSNLNKILVEKAENCGVYTKRNNTIKEQSTKQKPWFDKDCKNARDKLNSEIS